MEKEEGVWRMRPDNGKAVVVAHTFLAEACA
jgi:hypothetical protein